MEMFELYDNIIRSYAGYNGLKVLIDIVCYLL